MRSYQRWMASIAILGVLAPSCARDVPGPQSMGHALARGHVDDVAALLDRGADPNMKLSRGMTPLHWAAAHGDIALIRLLVSRGASLDPTLSASGTTPLEAAIVGEHADAAATLLELGATLDGRARQWAAESTSPTMQALAGSQ